MDIKQILNSLSSFHEIDFSDKKNELKLFAEKYDRNKNSIFEQEEIQNIKNDLSEFVKMNGNADELDNEESVSFIKNLLDSSKNDENLQIKNVSEYILNTLNLLINSGNKTEIKNYLQNNSVSEQYSDEQIEELSKLENKDAKWLINNLQDAKYKFKEKLAIAKHNSQELADFINSHGKMNICNTTDGCVKFFDRNENKYYTFDKTGLIETGETVKTGKDSEHTTIINSKLNIIHEEFSARINDRLTVEKEILKYYDNDSNIVKTVEMQRNPENGFINITTKDSNGNVVSPSQIEYIDSVTKAKITKKHLVSPEGVTMDFQSKQKSNSTVTELQIKDTDGTNLINIKQTFEKKSDNKFISSINATGNKDDTHIYEIVYSGNTVNVKDVKNDKTSQINLDEIFYDEMSAKKLMPIIKRLPGHVLLKFAQKPFILKYEKSSYESGGWNTEDKILTIIDDGTKDIGKNDGIYAIFFHESGHYIDMYNSKTSPQLNNQPDGISIYNKEFEIFKKSAITPHQGYISYFNSEFKHMSGRQERIAEENAIMHTINDPIENLRKLYLLTYFPKTSAAGMKSILEEYGIKTK